MIRLAATNENFQFKISNYIYTFWLDLSLHLIPDFWNNKHLCFLTAHQNETSEECMGWMARGGSFGAPAAASWIIGWLSTLTYNQFLTLTGSMRHILSQVMEQRQREDAADTTFFGWKSFLVKINGQGWCIPK